MEQKIRFGVAIPTGTEGLMFPIPYASARDVIEFSVYCEKLGFDSVWGNDHVHSQSYVLEEFGQQPRYYAPLLELAAIAERTTTLQVCTALLVLPFRHPAVMAKEIATLDHISKGRVLLGIGLGAYREEFEAQFGAAAGKMVRGNLFDESLEIMHRIFTQDSVTFEGDYFQVKELMSFPKPIQNPFPFYIGGNSAKGYERVAKYATGWLPAILTVEEVKSGVSQIQQYCQQYERSFSGMEIAPQFGIMMCNTRKEADALYQQSQLYKHGVSLAKSTMKGKDPTLYAQRNLVGSVDEVVDRIGAYIEAGVTHFSALTFANNTMEESMEHMQRFAEEVLPKFR